MNFVLNVTCRQCTVQLCFWELAQTSGAMVVFNTCRNIERELQEGNGVKGGKIGEGVNENGSNKDK
jgi:hypothetical protein